MGNETLEKVVSDFLEKPENEVLSLKGAWGVGKTYTWNSIFNKLKKEKYNLPSYSYVSLFGMSSLQELKIAIVMNTNNIKGEGEKTEKAKRWAKQLPILIDKIKGIIPFVKDITFSAESFLPSLIKDTIICFDDFERLTTNGSIKPEEVLGFISELKEEKNCKVVLIFNEEKLGSIKEVYNKYREKVIDIEFLFSPTVNEAVDIVFSDKNPYYNQIVEHCTKLKISNIRILKKIDGFIKLMDKDGKDFHPDVMKRAIQTLILVNACYYSSSNDLPDIDFLRNYKSISIDLMRSKNNKKQEDENTEKYEQWRTFVNSYQGYYIFTDLDHSIMDIVKKGYLYNTDFVKEAKLLHERLNMDGLKQSYDEVWNIYNSSFDNNEEEFVKESSEVFKRSIKALDINDLDSLVSVYNQLGRKELADELIEFYAKEKITRDNASTFIKHRVGFSRYEAVAKYLNQYAESFIPQTSLENAILYIAEHRGWSNNETDIMLAATENDYYNLFKKYKGSDLYYIVDICVHFPFTKEYEPIIVNSRSALKKIAEENSFNRVRILNMYNLEY